MNEYKTFNFILYLGLIGGIVFLIYTVLYHNNDITYVTAWIGFILIFIFIHIKFLRRDLLESLKEAKQ